MAATERGELKAEHYLACAYDVRHEVLVVFDPVRTVWLARCRPCAGANPSSPVYDVPVYRLGPNGLTTDLIGEE